MNIDKHLEEDAGRTTSGAGSTIWGRQVQFRELVEPPDPETQPSCTPGRQTVPKTIPNAPTTKTQPPQLPRPPKRFPNDTITTVPPKINPPAPTFFKKIPNCTHPNNWATVSCWKDIENDFWARQFGQHICWASGEMRFFVKLTDTAGLFKKHVGSISQWRS